MLEGRARQGYLFNEALDEASDRWTRPVPWADWRAPRHLAARQGSQLEVSPLPSPVSEVLRRYSSEMAQWLAEAGTPEQLRSIDSERLVSIIVGIRLAARPLAWDELIDIGNNDEYQQDRRATASTAHRETRPLFRVTALARALTAVGGCRRCVPSFLEAHLADASEAGNDGSTVRLAQREIARTIRRGCRSLRALI